MRLSYARVFKDSEELLQQKTAKAVGGVSVEHRLALRTCDSSFREDAHRATSVVALHHDRVDVQDEVDAERIERRTENKEYCHKYCERQVGQFTRDGEREIFLKLNDRMSFDDSCADDPQHVVSAGWQKHFEDMHSEQAIDEPASLECMYCKVAI